MARPRSNSKPQRKGTGSSFGKRSPAEKSYHKKGSSSRSDDSEPKRSFGKPSGFRKSTGSSFRPSDKPEFKKSSRPFSSRPERGDSRDKKEGFRPRGDGDRSFSKPFRAEGGEKRSFRRDDSSTRPFRSESSSKPDYTSKPGFSRSSGRPRRDDADAKGEGFKRSERSDGPRDFKSDSKPEGFKRPERSGSRPERSEGRDFKKDFKKPEGFHKRDSREGGDDRKKSVGNFKRPFHKDDSSEKGPERDFRSNKDEKSFGKEERKSFVQSRVITAADFTKPGRKPVKTEAPVSDEEKKSDGLTRLNKHVANSGVGSRRDADKLITMGLISVNGVTITELGTKVKAGDVVRYEDRILKAEKPVYILLNKPKGFITTTDDPQERNTVMGLVAGACKERIYPVGRLDRNTTGLLLLTNDGDLADKLTHPSYKAKKVYKVELDKPITKNDFIKVQEGVHLEEGRAMVDDVAIISDDGKTVGVEIHIGWNRVVRRIFETLGYAVVKLDRSVYAGLDKKDTPRGHWRFLKPEEIVALKHFK